jgi:hypothetical protein
MEAKMIEKQPWAAPAGAALESVNMKKAAPLGAAL